MNYEEKLKEAKRLYQTANSDQKYVLESLFPELAESEDEKIRKALIRFHKSTIDVDGIKGEDIIAWLEEQGEPNPYSGTSFKYNGHTWGMCARDYGVEVMIDRKLVAFINPDGDVKSMVKSMVESYQKRLANECNASVESPLVKICLTSYRHGIENTIDELELNGLNKRPE